MIINETSLLDCTGLFPYRHIGPRSNDLSQMLKEMNLSSLEELVSLVVPKQIRMTEKLKLSPPRSEWDAIQDLRLIASKNQVFRSFIGMGYSDCITPPVVQRNILENPGWYTQYTPYQAEIAQGRLEALLNFQTMMIDFTGLPIANASLLDEGTAAAEAMTMCFAIRGRDPGKAFFVSESCHPQTIAIIRTRAEPLGIQLIIGDHQKLDWKVPLFGVLLQYPATDGIVYPYEEFIARAHSCGALAVVAADLLSLALLKPPGEWGADIVVGNTQRFGVPLGYGGPHAAFFTTKEEFKRQIPGRIVGMSQDLDGNPAIRLALQTREQHIRRDKATSNICTAQVLLAVISSMYAVYHGPSGIRQIAEKIYRFTSILKAGLIRFGYNIGSHIFFDTLSIPLENRQLNQIVEDAKLHRMNLRIINSETLGISLDETTTKNELKILLSLFCKNKNKDLDFIFEKLYSEVRIDLKLFPFRTSSYLTHSVFNSHHSETEMLRYIYRLQSKDLSLTSSMIPLGSCTMKLNATSEMLPITWPEFGRLHPFAPSDQSQGYQVLFQQLETMLAEITGFAAVSLQPNAGSQGEYAGLLVIRKYHQSRGQQNRNVCLIPRSAHGTNPASAAMAGMKIVIIDCDESGNIDLTDLSRKAEEYSKDLAALMVTYPSTHGVFEESILEACSLIHKMGGQVYMDGANMNAQIGLCRPQEFGPDVCHLNLHKTFCIPHGGGGPGIGPIAVSRHLVPYLPGHPMGVGPDENQIGPVSAAPWGSASILPISWMYIVMMGAEGLALATQVALLNANYIAKRLDPYYPVLYRGRNGFVAHECIFDFRKIKESTGIEVEDVAKRLMDYGFHAPTISFPVAGTIMVEPTESESKAELDRFCDAMISIREEIREIESGNADRRINLLKNAPHTAQQVTNSAWSYPYSRERAVFPAPWVRENKFWPSVGRINNVLGDRNLVCSCLIVEDSGSYS